MSFFRRKKDTTDKAHGSTAAALVAAATTDNSDTAAASNSTNDSAAPVTLHPPFLNYSIQSHAAGDNTSASSSQIPKPKNEPRQQQQRITSGSSGLQPPSQHDQTGRSKTGDSTQSPTINSSPNLSNANNSPISSGASSPSHPWTARWIKNTNPFPRYGHASNALSGKEGEVFVFGGLVRGVAKNDLWLVNSSKNERMLLCKMSHLLLETFSAYNIQTSGDRPSPRVGHAGILVGNAFIGKKTSLENDVAYLFDSVRWRLDCC